jgi:hypothetical protein
MSGLIRLYQQLIQCSKFAVVCNTSFQDPALYELTQLFKQSTDAAVKWNINLIPN